jgi:hypothetical protein
MKKKIKFPKGINKIYYPIMLTPFSSWQDQIQERIDEFNEKYSYGKKAILGFEITDSGAGLILTK